MSHRETPRLGGLASQRAFSMASTVSWVDLGIPRETGNLAEKPGKSDWVQMSGLLRAPFEVVIESHCLFKVWGIESHLELPRIHLKQRGSYVVVASKGKGWYDRFQMVQLLVQCPTHWFIRTKGTAKLGISESSSNGGFLDFGVP